MRCVWNACKGDNAAPTCVAALLASQDDPPCYLAADISSCVLRLSLTGLCMRSQVQLEKLTETFQTVTEDLKRRFAVNGESLVDEANISGSSPMSAGNSPFRHGSVSGGSAGGFAVQRGFSLPQQRPSLASSGADACRLSDQHEHPACVLHASLQFLGTMCIAVSVQSIARSEQLQSPYAGAHPAKKTERR